MMKKYPETYIAVVCFLIIATPLFAITHPTNAILITDIQLPLISGNKVVGQLKVSKGENIRVLSETNDTIEFEVRNLKASTSIDNTNLKKIREEESIAIAAAIKEAEKKARLEEQKNSEENQRRIIEDAENGYQDTLYVLNDFKAHYTEFLPEDKRTIDELILLNNNFTSSFSEKSNEEKIKTFVSFKVAWNKAIKGKPIYGFKYNDFLDRSVVQPIWFNVFRDSEYFYLKVGKGSFCTIAAISSGDIMDILESTIEKIPKWSQKCKAEKLDAYKEIGQYGGVKLGFQSINNGEYQFMILNVRGPFSKESLLAEQKVYLDTLNYMCLLNQMINRSDLLEKKQQEYLNSKKLQ